MSQGCKWHLYYVFINHSLIIALHTCSCTAMCVSAYIGQDHGPSSVRQSRKESQGNGDVIMMSANLHSFFSLVNHHCLCSYHHMSCFSLSVCRSPPSSSIFPFLSPLLLVFPLPFRLKYINGKTTLWLLPCSWKIWRFGGLFEQLPN